MAAFSGARQQVADWRRRPCTDRRGPIVRRRGHTERHVVIDVRMDPGAAAPRLCNRLQHQHRRTLTENDAVAVPVIWARPLAAAALRRQDAGTTTYFEHYRSQLITRPSQHGAGTP